MVVVLGMVVRREEGAAGDGRFETELLDFGYDIDGEMFG